MHVRTNSAFNYDHKTKKAKWLLLNLMHNYSANTERVQSRNGVIIIFKDIAYVVKNSETYQKNLISLL